MQNKGKFSFELLSNAKERSTFNGYGHCIMTGTFIDQYALTVKEKVYQMLYSIGLKGNSRFPVHTHIIDHRSDLVYIRFHKPSGNHRTLTNHLIGLLNYKIEWIEEGKKLCLI